MKKKFFAASLVVVALAAVVTLWLADRPSDVMPELPEGAGHIAFNPKFGPRTTQEVEEYLQRRYARDVGSRYRTAVDRESPAGKAAWADAVDTLQRRWGLRPGMTQDEINLVRGQQEKIWAFVEHTRTTRYKIRSWLGLNK